MRDKRRMRHGPLKQRPVPGLPAPASLLRRSRAAACILDEIAIDRGDAALLATDVILVPPHLPRLHDGIALLARYAAGVGGAAGEAVAGLRAVRAIGIGASALGIVVDVQRGGQAWLAVHLGRDQ